MVEGGTREVGGAWHASASARAAGPARGESRRTTLTMAWRSDRTGLGNRCCRTRQVGAGRARAGAGAVSRDILRREAC